MSLLCLARNHVKWWWQRRTRGWDDRDLWSLDYTMGRWLLPRLVVFRERLPGTPLMCWEESDGTDGAGAPIMDKARERWIGVLDEMIAGFRAQAEDTDGDIDFGEFCRLEDIREAKVRRAWELLGKYAQCLWD